MVSQSLASETSAASEFDDGLMRKTFDAMRRVLDRQFGMKDTDLSPDRALASLDLDSLAFIEYMFDLENELSIRFPDLPRDLVSVGDLARFIHGEVLRTAAETSSR